MAIYHLSTKPVSRSSGRTATASIAYRAGIAIKDERTGKQHDYTKRSGVVAIQLHTPNNLQIERAELWNLAETTETRKNSRTAREIVVNLPHELSEQSRKHLVNDFAKDLADQYGVAVDVAIHTPDKEGDNRNHHAHLMLTTRNLERLESGKVALTSKSQLEMSNTQLKDRGLRSAKEELKAIRKQWADITNERLERAEIDARIDHRSYKDRGLILKPTKKLGWEATALERKGIATETGNYNRQVKVFNESVKELVKLNRQLKQVKTKEQVQSQPAEEPTNNKPQDIEALKTELSVNEKRRLLKSFHEHINQEAEKLLKSRLKQIREQAKPQLDKINQLRDSKPLNPFKARAWKQDINKRVEQYNKIKARHDQLKVNGVTKEHRTQAMRDYYLERPKSYDTMVDIQKELKEYDQQQEQKRAERQVQRAERGNDKEMER